MTFNAETRPLGLLKEWRRAWVLFLFGAQFRPFLPVFYTIHRKFNTIQQCAFLADLRI
jgi:hypothetical protein